MPSVTYIHQIADIHAEDLAFHWGQRRAAIDSPEHTLRDYAQLSERIEAHIQGLLVAPPAALRERFDTTLAVGADRDAVFAAGVAALRCGDAPAANHVIDEFSRATGLALDGLRDAMGQAPAAVVAEELRNALARARPAIAASAAVALANLRLLEANAPGFARLLLDDDNNTCALAWSAAVHADRPGTAAATPRPFREALTRPSPAVRHAAWAAAAWSGHGQLVAPLRKAVAEGDAVALHWLCMLGTADDTKAIGSAAMALETPAARCAALARFGHPGVLPTLVRWTGEDDPVQAHAAGEAFMRITGTDIRGERRSLPVPEGADEFDREMAPLVWMPDAAKARQLLEQRGGEWAAGTRWCLGRRLDVPLEPEQFVALDLQARWDVAARACLAGRAVSRPPPVVL